MFYYVFQRGSCWGTKTLGLCSKRLFWLMHADLRLRALDCCCLIHSQHRSKGSDLTTEPSHWTSVKGCVNSFSSVLHITISPSTRLSPTLGGSQLNLWRGQRLRPAPGWKTYCFSKRGGCAGNCNKKGRLWVTIEKHSAQRQEAEGAEIFSQVSPVLTWLTPSRRSKNTFSPAAPSNRSAVMASV